MFWVVCYDIVSDRRRRQVVKVLEGYGRRVQYSVFECEIDEAKRRKLEKLLRREIDEQEDDIRFYPLNQADIARIHLLGTAKLERTRGHYLV